MSAIIHLTSSGEIVEVDRWLLDRIPSLAWLDRVVALREEAGQADDAGTYFAVGDLLAPETLPIQRERGLRIVREVLSNAEAQGGDE